MGLDDRTWYLFLGIALGFLLGYLTCWVRDTTQKLDKIKEELDEVDEIVKEYHPDWRSRLQLRNERGVMPARLGSIALAVIVVITAIGAFQSQQAVNAVHDTQKQQRALISCTTQTLEQTIDVLNTRSSFTRDQAASNVDLQRAQSEMIAILLHQPPYTQNRQLNAFKKYFQALNGFVAAAGQAEDTAVDNPYPTVRQFNACITRKRQEGN